MHGLPERQCPHCGQRMLMRHGVLLSPKLADIFDLIDRRGRAGILGETLTWVFYGSYSRKTRTALAVNIKLLNDRLVETDIRVGKPPGDPQGPYRILKRAAANHGSHKRR